MVSFHETVSCVHSHRPMDKDMEDVRSQTKRARKRHDVGPPAAVEHKVSFLGFRRLSYFSLISSILDFA